MTVRFGTLRHIAAEMLRPVALAVAAFLVTGVFLLGNHAIAGPG